MIMTALSAWWWANYFTCLEAIQLSSHQAILGKLLHYPTFAKHFIFPVIFNSSNWYCWNFYPHCTSLHININFSSIHNCITVNLSFTWHESSLTPSWSSWSWRRSPASWWKCLSTSWMIIPGYPCCPKGISLASCKRVIADMSDVNSFSLSYLRAPRDTALACPTYPQSCSSFSS